MANLTECLFAVGKTGFLAKAVNDKRRRLDGIAGNVAYQEDKIYDETKGICFALETLFSPTESENTVSADRVSAEELKKIETVFGSLRKMGFSLAACSDKTGVFTMLKAVGLEEYFDYIVDAEEICHFRTYPELYLTAVSRLGLDPTRCAVIEMSPEGINAVKSSGGKAIGIGNAYGCRRADIVIENLQDLPGVMASFHQ